MADIEGLFTLVLLQAGERRGRGGGGTARCIQKQEPQEQAFVRCDWTCAVQSLEEGP